MTNDYEERLSQAEISQIIAGRATPEDIDTRRRAERDKAERQMQEWERCANPDLAAILRQIQTLREENEALSRRVAVLEAHQPLVLDGGKLPNNMSHLECQIFHTPLEMIPTKHRRVKTPWSLRLTAWIEGRKAKPDINVALYPGSQFYQQVMSKTERPISTETFANTMREQDEEFMLAGMPKAITKQKGRPYILAQFCAVIDYMSDQPKAYINIGEQEIALEKFIPGKGTKENRAKWYAKISL